MKFANGHDERTVAAMRSNRVLTLNQVTKIKRSMTNQRSASEAGASRPAVPPEISDVTACATWFYFFHEMTQCEVAIAVSCATVIKRLNAAKDRGPANIRIHPILAPGISMSRMVPILAALRRRFCTDLVIDLPTADAPPREAIA